ncbi:MAG: putative metalloprotease CJM1_0395 family protein, partial [Miltoncostaeaceae bacterium]
MDRHHPNGPLVHLHAAVGGDARGARVGVAPPHRGPRGRPPPRERRRPGAPHAAAGGQYAGAPSFTYQTGPDGKRYAVGGE